MACRRTSAWAVAALAAVAAATWWSCGGSPQTVTAPVAVSNAGEGSGGVTASASGSVTVCQNGKTIVVAANALSALLAHGATLGACTAGKCPCFTSATIATAAAACFQADALRATCPRKYSIALRCDNITGASLGVFEAVVGSGECSTTTWDTGVEKIDATPVGEAQFQACRQALVSSQYYPSGCPK
jgi:hypothetical protein